MYIVKALLGVHLLDEVCGVEAIRLQTPLGLKHKDGVDCLTCSSSSSKVALLSLTMCQEFCV